MPPVIPTRENPYGVSFSEDGKRWTITRDWFIVSPEGTMQAYVTEFHSAGDVLEPAVRYVGEKH